MPCRRPTSRVARPAGPVAPRPGPSRGLSRSVSTRLLTTGLLAALVSACAPDAPDPTRLADVLPPPGPPVDVRATASSPTAVDIEWSAPESGADGVALYRVYRGEEMVASPAATRHVDEGLEAFTPYDYAVSAVSEAGVEGERSGAVRVRTRDGTPPTAPSGMAVRPASSTQLDLTWEPASDPESGIAGYRIYRDGAQVGTTSGTPGFSDTGLASATTYGYEVAALNGDGEEGPRSEPAKGTTREASDASPPTRPSRLTATAVTGTQVDLTWSPASDPETGVAGYRVYRDGALVSTVAAAAAPSFTDVTVSPFTEYVYEVSAVNGEGVESPRSGPAAVRTPDDTPPTKPTGLTATGTGPSRIDLAWEPASDPESGVAAYRVYRDGTLVDSTAGATTYQDTGLEEGTAYVYEVSAVNGDDLEGPRSDPVEGFTGDGTPPTKTTGVEAVPASASAIDLAWEPASDPETGVAAYRIYRDGALVGRTDGTTSYTDTGLDPVTAYAYEVSAVNGQGLEGPRSDRVEATTLDDSPPTKPEKLEAAPVSASAIDLTWEAASDPETGIAWYRIYRDGALVDSTSGATAYTDTGLAPLTKYGYQVAAVNGDGLESGRSKRADATTLDGTPPTTPDDLEATTVSSSQVALAWDDASDPESGIAGYRIYRDGSQVGTTSGATNYLDTGLSPSTTYVYRVSAVNGDDLEGARCDPEEATTLSDGGLANVAPGVGPVSPLATGAGR